MQINKKIVLIVILITIWQTHAQTQVKTLSSSCLCDTTSNCDWQCCCDPECPSSLKSKLTLYDKCNDDNFGIPLCESVKIIDVHPDDLFSGLKTIYTVIKRLFCVARVNVVDPTTYYKQGRISNQNTITDAISKIDTSIGLSTLQPANIASLGQSSITGIFYRSNMGICSTTNLISKGLGTNGTQECRAFLATNVLPGDSQLSVSYITTQFSGIKVYHMSESSNSNPTELTNPSTTCNANTCSNIVKFLKLFINPSNNAINATSSYVIVGDVDISYPAYIMIRYNYQYLSTDGLYANVSSIGYKIGSPLKLIKKTNNNYFKVFNPFNLAFRKTNGQCRTASADNADQSLIELKLGNNQYFTCIGASSLIFDNLKNSFDYIGTTGSSNNKLGDFVQITWPATSTTSNLLLKIYYARIGAASNPQYYVVRATASQYRTDATEQKTFFVQYQQIETTASIYIPPPPTVDAYLPNDFLYPFYVAA